MMLQFFIASTLLGASAIVYLARPTTRRPHLLEVGEHRDREDQDRRCSRPGGAQPHEDGGERDGLFG